MGRPGNHLLHVAQVVGPSASSHYIANAVVELARRGVRSTTISFEPEGPLHTMLRHEGFEAHALGFGQRSAYPLAAPRLHRMSRGIDIIHAHEAIPSAVVGIVSRFRRGTAAIYHRHHVRTTGAHGAVSRVAARTTDLTVAVSEAVAEAAAKLDGSSTDKIQIVYNGVPEPRAVGEDELRSLRRRLEIDDEPIVATVARLRKDKGIETLLRAFGRLVASEDLPPRLIIVGTGPERERLLAMADQIDGRPATFVGHQADVVPWLHLADVVVVPSHAEAFGLTAAEAMACGRPLVASRVQALSELIEDGVSGLLVDPGDPESLAAALATLLRDPKLATRLGSQARTRYESNFTSKHMVEGWIGCYRRLLDRGAMAQ